MGFLAKLFKTKTEKDEEASSIPQHRSTSAPARQFVSPSHDTDSEDEDTSHSNIIAPGHARRAGCDQDVPSGRFHPRNPAGKVMRRSQDVALLSLLEARMSLNSAPSTTVSKVAHDEDQLLAQHYRCVENILKGRNCMIKEGLSRKTMQRVIIKEFTKLHMTETKQERRQREVETMLAAASVPHVMRLIETLEDDENFYTVVAKSPGFTLIELMANSGGRIAAEHCVKRIAIPLLEAIAGMHALGLVHRHLKPEHVMCDQQGVTVIDFLDSANMTKQCLNSRVGELPYMAPEVLSKPLAEDIFHQVLSNGMAEEDLPRYNDKADIWSIGVVLFEALTGQQPFLGETVKEMQQMQHSMLSARTTDGNGTPMFIARRNLPPLAVSFLTSVFQEDPARRPSAGELLWHPWLNQGKPGGGDRCISALTRQGSL